MPNFISEDQIEKATLQLLKEKLGYQLLNAYTSERDEPADGTERKSKKEVVLPHQLEHCASALNPQIPAEVVAGALERLQASRRSISPVQANYTVYSMLKNGIAVEYEDESGEKQHETLRLIDFNNFEANTFAAVRQLWIKGERYYRRPDILIYINGIPLVFIELKDSNVKVKHAYDDNLTNYRRDIPQLFDYNRFCILSNAVETKIGAAQAGWDYFFNWLRVDDEREVIDRREIERRATSLERVVYGLLEKRRLLDYLENFILYYKESNKIIAQNHQFLGVNKALESFRLRKEKQGKLGVFWHTQGSGKSFSMIFLSRKIFRKHPGNYTFVIVTDREDLDGQIYRNFLNTDTVKKNEAARPKNSREMRDFLGRNLRFVFTLIQKFRYDKGRQYPLLSDRSDIIVIVDEAHRTQYKSLAENMRSGLPNAQYYAFTGTPLLASRIDRDGKTRKWFGEYVSEYNFAQSIEDGATVPLYYEKRVPEVLIQNENLSDEFYNILEDENLDESQQEKLEREFSKEIEVINGTTVWKRLPGI